MIRLMDGIGAAVMLFLVVGYMLSPWSCMGKEQLDVLLVFRQLVLAWVAIIRLASSTSDWLVMLNFPTLVFCILCDYF